MRPYRPAPRSDWTMLVEWSALVFIACAVMAVGIAIVGAP
jgi:hypothetical protein